MSACAGPRIDNAWVEAACQVGRRRAVVVLRLRPAVGRAVIWRGRPSQCRDHRIWPEFVAWREASEVRHG